MPRSAVVIKYIPEPDQLAVALAPDGITLITNDGSSFTNAVCTNLQAKGHQVVVLTFPEMLTPERYNLLPADVKEIHLPDTKEETLRETISRFSGKVGRFIFLHPHFCFPEGQPDIHLAKEKNLLKAAFLLAKHLKQPLNTWTENHRTAFLTVTRLDGAFGTKNPGHVSIAGGGLSGLTKSLNLEWKKVYCRTLDIAPELDALAASEKIILELYDANQCLTEVAYDAAGNRFTLVAEAVQANQAKYLQSKITRDSVFLVTGGARGITAECVKLMAATFRNKFILAGRTELNTEEPAWAMGIDEHSALKRKAMEALIAQGKKPLPRSIEHMTHSVLAQREIRSTLASIQAHGAEAHYMAVDITDVEALKGALDEVTSITGKITGIMHGAGRLADKLIEHKTETDFDLVYDVKIQGLLSVIQTTSAADLKHLILFSSVAGFYGNTGQTDYAMANEVLNRFAHLFRKNHPGIHVVSINWGAWDSGMVSPELKKLLTAHHVALVPSEEGPGALLDQLSTLYEDQSQVILGGTLPRAKAAIEGPLQTYVIHRKLLKNRNPFLEDHIIQGKAVLPISMAGVWMNQVADDLYPGFHLFKSFDVKLFKGIVFYGHQPEDYQVHVRELEKTEEHIKVQVSISRQNGNKLPIHHYQSQVHLVSQLPHPPIASLPHLQNVIPVVEDASVIYEDGTLFHGDNFRGVKQILTLSETGTLLLCEHQGVAAERQGQFPVKSVNGFLSDIMYQGLLVWVRRYHGCACLPLRTEWAETYGVLPFGKPFYVSIHILKSNDFVMEADITAFDTKTGKIYMKSHRASVTISRELQWV